MSSSGSADPSAPTSFTRVCTRCRVEKPVEAFYRQRGKASGFQSACKACVTAARVARYRADPVKFRARNRARYLVTRERVKSTNRAWRVANPDPCRAATRAWRQANPEPARGMRLKTRFRVTAGAYEEVLRQQDGRCAVCRQPETVVDPRTGQVRALAVDHDHGCCARGSCGRCVRGLLCSRCNAAIGMARESAELLDALAQYLRRGPLPLAQESAA